MSYDRYLEAETNDYLDEQDRLADQYDNAREEIIQAIRNGKQLTYGNRGQYNVTPADCDLYDKVCSVQAQIMLAFVNDNDALMLMLLKDCCEKEIDSLVDLIL